MENEVITRDLALRRMIREQPVKRARMVTFGAWALVNDKTGECRTIDYDYDHLVAWHGESCSVRRVVITEKPLPSARAVRGILKEHKHGKA